MTSSVDAAQHAPTNGLVSPDDSRTIALAVQASSGRPSSSDPSKTASKSPQRNAHRPTSAPRPPVENGGPRRDDAQNESEAETEIDFETGKDDAKDKKDRIKVESGHDDEVEDRKALRDSVHVRTEDQHPKAVVNDTVKETKRGGADGAASELSPSIKHGRRKSSISISSSAPSRHDPVSSPNGRPHSPSVTTARSPSDNGPDRSRSQSILESRKRKHRDDPHNKALEPPRQKPKTEQPPPRNAESLRNRDNSPSSANLRTHKRSISTQSVSGRRNRDVPSLDLQEQQRQRQMNYSSDSVSDRSSSPQPPRSSNAISQSRGKRNSGRSLVSPARAMHKKNVDRFGATRLARESEKGDLEAVKSAYSTAPDELNQVDFAGIAPLQKASLNGHTEIVEFLIGAGCRTDCASNDLDTPLIDAVENGHLEVVELLLNKGKVNPHHQNKKGHRAIDVVAPSDEDADELKRLLNNAMKRHSSQGSGKESLSESKNKVATSTLLWNEYNPQTMRDKAAEGNIVEVDDLLSSGVIPNTACCVAAARGGHADVLNLILAYTKQVDPDPAKHSETPMLVAIGRGHLNVIDLLLKLQDFNPTRRNRDGKTYWELSEERRGPKWEQERDMLKARYDEYLQQHSKSPKRRTSDGTNSSSPARAKAGRSDGHPSPIRAGHKSVPLRPQNSEPTKRSRLISGKERNEKRRRRLLIDQESSEGSDSDIRPPAKKLSRAESDPEPHRPQKKVMTKQDSGDHSKSRKISGSSNKQKNDSDLEIRRAKKSIEGRRPSEPSKPRPAKPGVDANSDPELERKRAKAAGAEAKSKDLRRHESSGSSLPANKIRKIDTSQKSTPPPSKPAESISVSEPIRTPTPTSEEHKMKAEDARNKDASKPRAKEEADARAKEKEASEQRARKAAAAAAAAKEKEESEARARKEEEARLKKEKEAREKEKAEAEARAKREAEARAKREAEAARIKAEAEAEAKAKAEEEARRKEEAEARAKKEAEARERERAEAEARAKAKAEAEARAKALREAEEARAKAIAEEQARIRAEAERLAAERAAAEAAERAKRAEEERRIRERDERVAKLPAALKRACLMGDDRPLHFRGTEMGISKGFLPVYVFNGAQIAPEYQNGTGSIEAPPRKYRWFPAKEDEEKLFLMSFHAVGILGLDDPDVTQKYPSWPTKPVTHRQRELFLEDYDIAQLAQDFLFDPNDSTLYTSTSQRLEADADYTRRKKDAKTQFLNMEPMHWVRWKDLMDAVAQKEKLKGLEITASRWISLRPYKPTGQTFSDFVMGRQTKC